MVRRGRRLSLYGRLADLERRKVVCATCVKARGLRAEVIRDESGTSIAVRFGDHREYCEECGRRPSTGVTLHRGKPR